MDYGVPTGVVPRPVVSPEQRPARIYDGLLEAATTAPGTVRTFPTGATRSGDAGRYDPEGFLSPIALERYCEYMNAHRVQPDGTLRDSDNWQRGMPIESFMKGMWRHVLHLWTRHRGYRVTDPDAALNMEADLCAVIFNAQGMLHELLRKAPAQRNSTGTASNEGGTAG